MEKTIKVQINDAVVTFKVEGETVYGAEEVLLEKDDNLIATTSWLQDGYTVQPFLEELQYHKLSQGIKHIVKNLLHETGIKNLENFALTNYHNFVGEAEHAAVVKRVRGGFPIENLPVDIPVLTSRISEICNVPLSVHGSVFKQGMFWIRIIRPMSNDNNPPHRDVWLNRLRNAVNIYVPICGSNERSSLPLVPESHLWKESEIERTVAGAKIDGITFTVPSVTGAKREMKMIRPTTKKNEVLVFSPYLIHGCGINLNENFTRFSLEMRFWRKDNDCCCS